MKKGISIFLTLAFAAVSCAADANRAFVKLSAGGQFEIVSAQNAEWKTERKNRGNGERTFAHFSVPVNSENWTKLKIEAVSKTSQDVYLTLQPEDAPSRRAAYFEDVKLNGKTLRDNGFESEKGWTFFGNKNKFPPRHIPADFANGEYCLRVSPTNPAQTSFRVEGGEKFSLTLLCRDACELDKIGDTFPIDISAAKVGKKIAAAKKFNALPTDRIPDGVPIVPSAEPIALSNNEKASLKTGENVFGRYAYLLSATSSQRNEAVGRLTIKFKNGKSQAVNIVNGHSTGNFDARTVTRFCAPLKTAEGKYFYLTRIDIPFGNGKVSELLLQSLNGRDFAVSAISFSQQSVDTSADFVPRAPDWRKADIGDTIVKAGTVLDLSDNVAPCAGSKGRIIINKYGKFAFANEPDKSVRFRACMTTLPELIGNNRDDVEKAKASIVRRTSELKRGGYNLVRVWGLELPFAPNDKYGEKMRDIFDFFIEQFRREGIYIDLMLPLPVSASAYDDNGIKNSHAIKFNFMLGDKQLAEDWAKRTAAILSHKNKISGIAIKDDPVILTLEYINEIGLGPQNVMRRGGKPAEFGLKVWRAWLANKYRDIGALNSAWKTDFKTFGSIDEKFTVNTADWRMFIIECGRKFHNFCEKTMRDAGYKGLVNQYNFSPEFAFSALRAEGSDYVALNTYFAHPYYERGNIKGWSDNTFATVAQTSSIGETASYFLRAAQTKISGRPFIMTEYKHCFWNSYQYEEGLVFPAYAALQDFSATCSFIRSMESANDAIGCFTTANNPVAVANELLAYCLFARKDVAHSKSQINLTLASDFLQNAPATRQAMGRDQSRIALLAGFSLDFPEAKKRPALNNAEPPKADLSIAPAGYSAIEAQDWFAKTLEGSDGKFDLAEFVNVLKSKKILSADNLTDVSQGVYQSDTKQLTLFSREKKMTVSTAKSQAAALTAGDSATLENLEILSTSENAAVALCAMDGKKIANSSRLVFIYATSVLNTDMRLSEDRSFAKDMGKPPALLKTGKIEARIKLKKNAKYALYPLSLSGERREKLALKNDGDRLAVSIDTSKLKYGATTLFEIAEEK